MLATREDAYALLQRLGAPKRLLTHLQLVGEAADDLIVALVKAGMAFDADLVRLGVAVHDCGKILHPEELNAPGSLHETDGEQLMLKNAVQPPVARCCVSHAAWRDESVSFEERVVALADRLWKGKREIDLETLVINQVAKQTHADWWDVFAGLDLAFESIAAQGEERLGRSRL